MKRINPIVKLCVNLTLVLISFLYAKYSIFAQKVGQFVNSVDVDDQSGRQFSEEMNSKNRYVHHTVQFGETISTILFGLGIGTKESKFKIYGEDGWFQKTKKQNPHVKNWDSLPAGTVITIENPRYNQPITTPPQEVVKEIPANEVKIIKMNPSADAGNSNTTSH